MNLELVHIFSNLLGLFLLIAVGYGAVQLGVISKDSSGSLSRLLLKITLPCTIFTSLLRPYDPAFFKEVIIILALGILLFPLNTLISPLLARLFQVPKSRRGVWNFCASFCNTGFMGFPIVLALFGEKGLSMAVVFNITFNLLVYSLGAKMICSDSPPDDNGSVEFRWRSVLFTAINGSTLLGLIFYFAQLSVPAAVLTPLTHLSNVTTPLSMIVTGINLSNGRQSDPLRSRDAMTAYFARLIICPLVSFLVLTVARCLLPLQESPMLGVIFVILAMPTPAVATILAENYGADQEFSALAVFFSSLFCIVTIPLMALLIA